MDLTNLGRGRQHVDISKALMLVLDSNSSTWYKITDT